MLTDKNGNLLLVDDETGEVLAEPFFKTPYNHDRNAESDRTGLACKDPTLTDQSFKEDADINTIIDRALKGQEFPIVLPEHFGNGVGIPSLYEARSRIAESNATFYNLPPKIREEFLNDPGRWEQQVITDLANGNTENLQRMGLTLERRATTAPNTPGTDITPPPATSVPPEKPSGGKD